MGEETICTEGSPIVVRSKLGRFLSGPVTSLNVHVATFSHLAVC